MEGESVPTSCCLGAGQLLPHDALSGGDTCFVLGPGLIPFSGCVGPDTYGYGENCVGDGAPFMAVDPEECGCSFVIEGSGCYKANDIPGQQWFVFLDGDSCEEVVEPPEGAYWAIYNETEAPADASCLVMEGESVPTSCCLGAGQLLPHDALSGGDTCFVLGPGLIPFSGCVGPDTYGYGENCVGDGAPFMAVDPEECGCSFVIEGSGCYKANDIPGQQWFVFLDGESCVDGAPSIAPSMAPTAEEPPRPIATVVIFAAALVLIGIVAAIRSMSLRP